MRNTRWRISLLVIGAGLTAVAWGVFFRAPGDSRGLEVFVVPRSTGVEAAMAKIKLEGLIVNGTGFRIAAAARNSRIQAGGYVVSRSMNAWKLAGVFSHEPTLVWITVPEGLRKEEAADLFARELAWPEEERENFIRAAEEEKMIVQEGVYFPDTYLVPKEEGGSDAAQRMFRRFNEAFAPLAPQFLAENIKSDTALKIASLVQREAADSRDMPLIAGIIWNRLLQDMKLDIDATLQYARGKTEDGWWGPIGPDDKGMDSPYNTYRYRGLPPQPITNPGIDAIAAVLHPAKTDCLFYLHAGGETHCAQTYEKHLENIELFLN